MKKAIITTDKLCKTFSGGGTQQHVLKNLDLTVYEGDFTVVMGSSGAGKSTLLYALSGMDVPTLGTISFSGEEISKYSQDKLALFRRGRCGFVFQQIHLINGMNVFDNVMAAGLLVSRDKKGLRERAQGLFDAVGIDEQTRKKFPSQLSGGEAQRVGIVRALINDPDVVFADEPTGALNSASGGEVLDTLTRFNRNGQSIIMVTHDLRSARRGNRILYLKDGVITGECDLGVYAFDDENRREKLSAFLRGMGW